MAKNVNMRKLYVQYIFNGTILTGGAVFGNCFYRARAMAKYAEARTAHASAEKLQHWAFMANVTPLQLERASWLIARFRAQGMLAAVGAPLLWATWQLSRNRRLPKNR